MSARLTPARLAEIRDGLRRSLDDGCNCFECLAQRDMLAEIDALTADLEQKITTLAGVSTAAYGATNPEHVADRDAWGWSPAYQDTLDLRRKYDALRAERREPANASMHSYLDKMWRGLRNSAGISDVEYVRGAIGALYAASVLSHEQYELWMRRIETCPGHDDEGGRSWCAFCGDMPADAEVTS